MSIFKRRLGELRNIVEPGNVRQEEMTRKRGF